MYSKHGQFERSLRELECLEEQLVLFTSNCHDLGGIQKFLTVQIALLRQAINHLKAGMGQHITG